MATQTVFFNNPADITSLQTTTTSMSGSIASLNYGNNWTRGQFVSSDLIYTIPAWSWTGPLPSLQGPAQDVSVYKVVYYSSDSTTSSVQRVSASVYVPAAISKTGSIVLNIKGLQPGNNVAAVGWETYSNPTLQAGLTFTPPLDPSNPASPAFGIIFPSTYAIEAGLGYITCDADGFGLGESQNDCVFNYMSQVNPQVDLLRCLRNMYTSGISSQNALFDNAGYSGTAFPVTVSGYSLGGIYAPAVANEFSDNVSATIPSTEASSFNFKRILCGAVPDGQNLISLLSNTNIGNFTVNPVLLFLFSNIGGNQPTHSLFAQPEALSTYWSFWTDIDQKANFSQDVANLAQLLGYSTAVAPPTATYAYNLAGFGTDATYGFTGADLRQLYRPEYTGSLGRVLKNLHGWTNPNRPLYTLPTGTSVAHIYSTLDEVVCPYGYTGSAPVLYGVPVAQQADYNFDSAATLDRYMNAGDVALPYYNFTGASRPVTFSEIAVDPTLGFSSTGAVATSIVNSTVAIASATTLKNNTYARIPVNFNDSYTFLNTFAPGEVPAFEAIVNHGGFFLYYQTVVNSALNSFTNAN